MLRLHLDINELIELFEYNKDSGVIKWKIAQGSKKAGSIAGRFNEGRIDVTYKKRHYKAHRIAWAIFYGNWPCGEIDHIDGNALNNAIENLRDVSKTVNMQNRKKSTMNNSSQRLGVSWHAKDQKWRARITIDGKQKWLGNFDSPDDAFQRYLSEKRKMHEGCTI